MIAWVKTFAADESGTSLIEMAMVAPFISVLMIGAVDLSNGFSQRLQLEQAAHRAIEKVQAYQTTSSTYATLRSEAAAAADVPESAVTIDYWLECDGARQTNYDSSCSGSQTYARWVTVEVQKTYTPHFSLKWAGANADGTYTLKGKAGMRTQ
jgi:Flp pilus assembly protein TadG